MHFVSPKTEAKQTLFLLHRLRESLVRERINTANQMHGFTGVWRQSGAGLGIIKRPSSVLGDSGAPIARLKLGRTPEWARISLRRGASPR